MKTAPNPEGNDAAVLIAASAAKPTKIATIAEALLGGSLNRFEAESLGDHCLNSTTAELRGRGIVVLGRWEEVPNRFGTKTRVQRYSIPPSEADKVRLLASSRRKPAKAESSPA